MWYAFFLEDLKKLKEISKTTNVEGWLMRLKKEAKPEEIH